MRAQLLQLFYSVRSERLLMEQLHYNLLYRWFVGMAIDDAVWDHSVFSKNRDRLLGHAVVEAFFGEIVDRASPADRMGALLHDAPEYVIGDMISPFKTVLGGDYKLVEHRLEGAIRLRFGLTAHMTDEMKARVKEADQAAAFYEATRLAGFDVDEALQFFGAPPPGLAPDMTPLSPTDAQAQFVGRFMELQAEMDGSD